MAATDAPLAVPAVEERQLSEQNDRLDRVETRRPAFDLVDVLASLAVLPERSDASSERLVVRHQGAGVSEGAEVLAGIEAERVGEPGRARGDAVAARAVRLACVLEDHEPAALGDLDERSHVGELAVEVRRHQEPGALGQRSLDGGRVEVVVLVGRVDHDRPSAGLCHSLECCDERARGHDDLVARLEACGLEPEPERVEAARQADAVLGAAVGGKGRLELADLRAIRECARIDEVGDLLDDVRLQITVKQPQIEERDVRSSLEKPSLSHRV